MKPVQALIADSCTSCALNRINIPFPVFVTNLTNNQNVGSVPITFRQVCKECVLRLKSRRSFVDMFPHTKWVHRL